MRRLLRFLALALILSQLQMLGPVGASSPQVHPPHTDEMQAKEPIASAPPVPVTARHKIDPALLRQLLDADHIARLSDEPADPVTFLVYLEERANLQAIANVRGKTLKREALVAELQRTAKKSQVGVIKQLNSHLDANEITRYESYWVFNGLAVDGGLGAAVALAGRDDVAYLRPNRIHDLPTPIIDEGAKVTSDDVEWNITQIGADRVWDTLGVTGEGVVVANMDSGVDWTHPALQHSYRGYHPGDPSESTHDYNWFDATDLYPDAPGPNAPRLGSGSDHGTHTMGTIVGLDPSTGQAIGVAPGARWIALKLFDNDGHTTDEWLHAGFQWVLAPTDLAGNNPDPSKAPDIVSNSWGDDNGTDETFSQDLKAWNAAGIFSCWASGNAGPGAGTVGAPGSLGHAMAVGATNSRDEIASFSSRGPSPWGEIKPEVCAPGVSIRSSIAGGTLEAGWNGTSMATPHVAGLAALMWSASGHSLSITATQHMITNTAQELGVEGDDNIYGYGRIDAFQAVAAVNRGGTFSGLVTDQASGAPIANALISMTNTETGGSAKTRADAVGIYSFSVAEGTYDVTASQFGYDPAVANDIEIRAQITTQLDFRLPKQPSGILAGRVSSASDDSPVDATISVLNTPIETTVDAMGRYTATLPVGTYNVRVLPIAAGHSGTESAVTITTGETITLDASLATAPRLLIVDADASLSRSYVSFYEADLDNLLYGYNIWSIDATPDDIPDAATLSTYDIVIWSQPLRSPGYIGAWDELGAFLENDGRLIISGQDIGYWDYDKNYGREDYVRYLHAEYMADSGGLSAMAGTPGDLLDGITLTFGSTDSAGNQTSPDAIASGDGLAQAIMGYQGGGTTGLRSDACDYRTVYLSFGIEGTGPADQRGQVLQRTIDWLTGNAMPYSARWSSDSASQVAAIGGTAIYNLTLINQGTAPAAYSLSVDAGSWESRLVLAHSDREITTTPILSPCATLDLQLKVAIPDTAILNETQPTTIRATALQAPDVEASAAIETTGLRPWYFIRDLPTPGYRMSCAVIGDAILAIGGYRGDGSEAASSDVSIYDTVADAWSSGANKPTSAANSSTAVLEDRVYVIGGYDPNADPKHIDAVEVYDPATDTWSSVAPLPVELSGTAATALDGRVYVFGGNTADGDSDKSYVYDPSTDTWSEGGTLPEPDIEFAQAVSLDGSIYLAGGWSGNNTLYRYDVLTHSFQRLAAMNTGRNSFALIAAQGYLFVAGGGDGWDGLASAERYDPVTDTWREILPLQVSDRVGTSGAYARGRFYVIGGVDAVTTPKIEVLDLDEALGGSSFRADRNLAQQGERLDYTLVVRNPSATDTSALWRWPVPNGLDYVAGSATGGAVYDEASKALGWAGIVPASGTLAFDFAGKIHSDLADPTTITSTVSLGTDQLAERDISTTTRVARPSLAASAKRADRDTVGPGETLHYTINIANESPYTITAAALADPIPEHTTYREGSVTGGAIYNAGLDRIEWHGALPAPQASTLAFNWIDATGGHQLDLTDDSCQGPLDIEFEFEFYGHLYDHIYVNSNGLVLFDECSSAYGNARIPSATSPNNFIAPFWDDLRPGRNDGEVYLQTFGNAPNRYAVIEWYQVETYSSSLPQTFEVILYEGANRVLLQYLTMTGDKGTGTGATVGIENAEGTQGVQYLYNGDPAAHALRDGLAVEMVHSSTRQASIHTITYDVDVDAVVPPLTVIENRAMIQDGLNTHTRTATTTVHSVSFKTASKRVMPQEAISGETVTYTLRLINSGTVSATDAALVDLVPDGLTYVPDSLKGEGATYDPAQARIDWSGIVPAGSSALVTYQATVDEGLATNTWITNTATLHERGTLVTMIETGLLCNSVDLSTSTKQVSADQALAGNPLTYTITIANSGMTRAEQVTMTDTLPAGLEMLPESVEGGSMGDHAVTWQGDLDPNEDHVVTFQARILPDTMNNTIITNTAIVADSNGHQHARQASTVVQRGDLAHSDLDANMSLVLPGGRVMLIASILNDGAAPVAATLQCTPPEPLTLVPEELYASSGVIDSDGTTITWEGTVAAQSMVVVRYACDAPDEIEESSVLVEADLVDQVGTTHILEKRLYLGHGIPLYLPLLFQRID